jgi:starch-binding outer membrane protein, SusD/RagB family
MNMIQAKKIILSLFCTGLLLSSCTDFLDEKPYSFLSPENLETTPTGVKQMVTGMYSVFFNAQMFRNESWIYITFCDNEWTDGVEWAMSTYGVGNFSGGWIYNNSGNDPYYVFYRIVRAANSVLEALPNVEFDESEGNIKGQFEGEALTLRSWAYFNLVQMYGVVPLHLKTDDPSTMLRTPITEVYDQIIKDLHTAEGKLYLKSETPLARGHITKGAAQLLLAKVYNTIGSGSLTNAEVTVPVNITRLPNREIVRDEQTFTKNKVMGYDFDPMVAYDSAKAVALRLMETHEYEMERYAYTWNPSNFGGDDFVFAIETDSLAGFTTVFNKVLTPVGLGGQGWLHYTKDLYYLYDSLDERGLLGIAHRFKYQDNVMQIFPPEDLSYYQAHYAAQNPYADINSNSCYVMKWYTGNAEVPRVNLSGESIVNSPTQNYPLLRYTEAYFILAEAENEINGPTTMAYDALDEVRYWRYRPDSKNPDYYKMNRTLSQQQLRSYILEERNREFIGEELRRFDLIRWGIYLQVMNAVSYRAPYLDNQTQIISKKREQKHLLYPVPTIEIDGNTAFGANNPGW